jgi:hypothetical protein
MEEMTGIEIHSATAHLPAPFFLRHSLLVVAAASRPSSRPRPLLRIALVVEFHRRGRRRGRRRGHLLLLELDEPLQLPPS